MKKVEWEHVCVCVDWSHWLHWLNSLYSFVCNGAFGTVSESELKAMPNVYKNQTWERYMQQTHAVTLVWNEVAEDEQEVKQKSFIAGTLNMFYKKDYNFTNAANINIKIRTKVSMFETVI